MTKLTPTAASRFGWVVWLILSVGGAGCASARMSDHESDHLFQSGRYEEAAKRLEKGYKDQGEDGKDSLLFLLDLGLALHSAGNYEESNKAFLKADKVAEIKDYTSLSAETATLVASENLKDYKGEDFEKILINTYLAMNYALMGDYENALVEARRVNQKLYRMIHEGGRKYQQNAFARYLSAVIYEADGNYNDAYIDYKNTQALLPELPGLGRDLWRCAWALEMPDQMDRWDETYHLTEEDHRQAKLTGPRSHKGEIIILYENGISPIKRPNPEFRELPKFYPRFNPVRSAWVELNGKSAGQTVVLEDIEATAIRNLDEKYGGLIAKKVAGLAVKTGIAYGIARATDNSTLGILAGYLLMAADQADLRSWNLLPRDLQILRIPVDPGTYQVRVLPGGYGMLPEKTIQVSSGKKVFVNFRYMP